MPFTSLKLHPRSPQRAQRARFSPAHPDPDRRDSAGPRQARRARLRGDRQRQDGGLPAADPAPAHGAPAGHHARPRPDADARAGGADPRATPTISPCTRRSPPQPSSAASSMGPQEHAFRSGVDVLVATPGRLLDHFRSPYAEARWPRASRARRSRPDARHGLPARTSGRSSGTCRRGGRRSSSAPRSLRRSRRWPREMLHDPVDLQSRPPGGAGRRDHAGRLPGPAGAQVGAA